MRTLLLLALLLPLLASADVIQDPDTGKPYKSIDGALPINKKGADAGERNEGSLTGQDYTATAPECAMSAQIDLSNDASTTINPGPTILCGYRLLVTVGTTAVTFDDSTTAKMTIPVSWPVGEHDGFGAIFEQSLVVNPDNTSTGTIQLFWKPAPSYLNWVP